MSITMQELELETAELLPARETLGVCRHPGGSSSSSNWSASAWSAAAATTTATATSASSSFPATASQWQRKRALRLIG